MNNHATHTSRNTPKVHPNLRPMILTLLAAAGVMGALGGCVSQPEYDGLVVENRTLTTRNQELQAALDESEAAQNALSSTVQGGDQTISSLQDQLQKQNSLIADYESTITDLEKKMQGISFGPLDAATDAALAELATNNPSLLTYDSNTGMLRFSSDLTFDSGSDAVKASAKQTLAKLADILKASSASQYDLIIVGHTDSQVPGANTRKKHPSNMYLSAHRAIAVRQVLIGLGIPASKIEAAGWGEQRPLVPNNPDGNTPANRRVEIYLGRTVGGSGSAAPAAGAPAAGSVGIDRETPPDRQPAITK